MTRYHLMIAAASAALLLGSAGIGAQAFEVKAGVGDVNANVTVGGGSTAQAKANVGNTANANATLGGGGGNVATAKTSVGNSTATANIGTGGSPLANHNTSGNPDGGFNSDTSINLGALLGSSPVVPGGGDGGGTGGGSGGNAGLGKGGGGSGGISVNRIQAATAGMSSEEIAAMKRQCGSILAMPFAYDEGLVDLCHILRRL
ncbi:MAG TPA: hypothetical protein VFK86_11240 [Bauldia sp.]|nr:hypothetical protein [Bauldia sp.]